MRRRRGVRARLLWRPRRASAEPFRQLAGVQVEAAEEPELELTGSVPQADVVLSSGVAGLHPDAEITDAGLEQQRGAARTVVKECDAAVRLRNHRVATLPLALLRERECGGNRTVEPARERARGDHGREREVLLESAALRAAGRVECFAGRVRRAVRREERARQADREREREAQLRRPAQLILGREIICRAFDALDAGRRRERRDETDALVDVLRAPLERDARPADLLLDARAAAGIEHLGVGGAECGLDAQYANDANARTQPE